eukprot:TRINITY_DN1988_c0_g2_i1.p1 TRINITY_DN1988_c0_g2~~TRINITY_DN1988_c0_g2_i1.p1  ORF type:complete len:226 (-),score=97.00 TRINITY_DN1988_c0_g2_i1:161-838(-)
MLPQHRESEHNSKNMTFEFVDKAAVQKILNKYPGNYKQSAIIPLLDLAQRQNNNWVSLAAMNKIAEITEVPPIRVYETCSFYSMFNREPVGKYLLQVCGTTPCQLRGSEKIIHAIEKHLKIHTGETTSDGLFTLMEVECLGACVNAPMMQLNDDFFEDLTEESTVKLLDDLKAGKPVKIGPQTDRRNSIGPQGRTSLFDAPSAPPCRDFDALKAKAEADKKAAAK